MNSYNGTQWYDLPREDLFLCVGLHRCLILEKKRIMYSIRRQFSPESKRLCLAIVASVAACIAPAAQGAAITWGTPTNDTGNSSDIINSGTFIDSAFIGNSSVTANGVTFNGLNSSVDGGGAITGAVATFDSGSNIRVNNLQYQCTSCFPGPDGFFSDSNYQALTGQMAFSTDAEPAIVIGGLTVGDDYQVQIFTSYWNNNFSTAYSVNSDGSDGSGYLNLGDSDSPAQYVTGTFTADATSQTIYAVGNVSDIDTFDAIQVRSAVSSTPEPAPLALLTLGLGVIGLLRRPRSAGRR
jgi:MYXO-CTERM domain-containing protein